MLFTKKERKHRTCISSRKPLKDSSSTKLKVKYVIPVTTDFSLSLKRVNKSWKLFYGLIKVPTPLSTKLPAITGGGGSTSNISILVRLLPLSQNSKPMLLRYLFKTKTVKLLTSRDFEFVNKPFTSKLDLVASNLRIARGFEIVPEQSEDFLPIARRLVYNLRRKLRKHRQKHLGLINMNTNIRTSDTNEGRAINAIAFGLNKSKKISRSARKRQNKIRLKKALEYKVIAQANRLKKITKVIDQRKKEKAKEIKLKENFEEAVALAYLKELKSIEKFYPSTPEKHLDMLFNSIWLPKKIILLEKEFFDSEF
jgi:hypothetical protein